jgi:hypothetical protein
LKELFNPMSVWPARRSEPRQVRLILNPTNEQARLKKPGFQLDLSRRPAAMQ